MHTSRARHRGQNRFARNAWRVARLQRLDDRLIRAEPSGRAD
jgi:hypothetical protein